MIQRMAGDRVHAIMPSREVSHDLAALAPANRHSPRPPLNEPVANRLEHGLADRDGLIEVRAERENVRQ